MASFGLKKFKRNGTSGDKVKLKCFFGEEISVLTVPQDIKYRHLLAKIEELFGEGIAIHKYEDHVGDLITVHSKQDVRDAFLLYAKAIRKQSKKDSVEPYLKVHLTKEDSAPSPNTPPSNNGTPPGSTPPAAVTPTQRRRPSKEKEKDREAREREREEREREKEKEREKEREKEDKVVQRYNRPISKSTPVMPTNLSRMQSSSSKSPTSSPPRKRQSWRSPSKERDTTPRKKRNGGKSKERDKDHKDKDKRRKKRISWKLKDGKSKQIEKRTDESESGDRDNAKSEREEGRVPGDRDSAEELSGSAGRGRSFIRRITPTKKKIERIKSADDKDGIARGGSSSSSSNSSSDASESEPEDESVDGRTTSSGGTDYSDIGDEGTDGEDSGEEHAAGARPVSDETSTENGGALESEEDGAEDDDPEAYGSGMTGKQGSGMYSPLLQHLPSGSPVVPAHDPVQSPGKRKKLTIQTDMAESVWDESRSLRSSRGRSNSDSSVFNPPPATHTPPPSPRGSFSEFSTEPLLSPSEYEDYINAVPAHMRAARLPPALSSPDSHLPSFPGSPIPMPLSPPILASPTSHLPSLDLGSSHLSFPVTMPISIAAQSAGGLEGAPAKVASVSPPPVVVPPMISPAAVYPPPLSSPTSHLPSHGLSAEDYFQPSARGNSTLRSYDEPLVVADQKAGEGRSEASLVPIRTPPKPSLLLDVKDAEEVFDETSGEDSDSASEAEDFAASRGEQQEAVAGVVKDTAAKAEQNNESERKEKEKGKSKGERASKRKSKKKRKAGAKGTAKKKIKRAPYCEDWSKVNWKTCDKLGAGAYGVVYSGQRDDGAMFAVKQIVLRADEETTATSKEIEVMKDIHHENIVQYLGTLVKDNVLNIFMEYVPGGSLSNLIAYFGALSEPKIRLYTKQILQGLAYLHKNGIVHRDIKGANILVDTAGKVKLADFGCSKKFTSATLGASNYKSIVGTAWWMAPEVVRQSGYGRAADIWSLGCTIVEMATCRPPWSECTNMVATLFKISNAEQLPDIPSSLSKHCKDFLAQCFIRDPKQRPTAAQLLSHPFITQSSEATQTEESSNSSSSADSPAAKEETAGMWRMKREIRSLVSVTTSTSAFFRLPKPLALHVFSFVSLRDIDSLAQVCKYWNLLTMELWEQKCGQWPCKAMKSAKVRNSNRGRGPNWRRLYVEGEEKERRVEGAQVAVTTLKGHHKTVYAVQYLDSTSRIASASEDKRLRFWEFAKGKWRLAHSAKAHTEGIYCLNFDSRNENKLLISGSADKSIRLWDINKYKNVRTITGAHEWGVTGLQYDSSHGTLASSALDGTIKLWNAETGKNVLTLRGHIRGVYSCNCRDNLVVSGSVDETVRLWDKRDGCCIAVLKGHTDEVTSVKLDEQADNVISGSGDATIRCWDIGTGECWNTWTEEVATATATAQQPEEGSNNNKHWVWSVDLTKNYVFSASQDRTIRIWDFTNGSCLRTLAGDEGHQGSVQSLAVSRDRLVSGGKDATVKIWQFEGIKF